MENFKKLVRVLLIALPFVDLTSWSQQPAVNGYYDAHNDWFVFQWMNPEMGQKQSIYDSSNKVKPVIHAQVSADSSSVYTFQFQVSNLSGAVQILQKIFIPHLSGIFNPANPSAEWDSHEYRNEGIWAWDKTLGAVHGLPAGQAASGFSFKSKGLPTIVTGSFAGARRAKYTIPSPDDDPEEVQSSFEQKFASLKAQYPDKFIDRIQLKTIGPIDPPASFNAMEFIRNLISLKEQSLALRWIDNQGIATSLDAKLNAAKAKIAAGDNQTAKNIVNAFLNDVQAQNGKHLSSEARALLYYNGQYLVNHL